MLRVVNIISMGKLNLRLTGGRRVEVDHSK